MSVLSRGKIRERLKEASPWETGLVITPLPEEDDWSADAVNLRLGAYFLLPQSPPPPFLLCWMRHRPMPGEL